MTSSQEIKADSYFEIKNILRTDLFLVQIIESLKEKANGFGSKLSIVTIPDNVVWEIAEYDGMESIHEKHRSWP